MRSNAAAHRDQLRDLRVDLEFVRGLYTKFESDLKRVRSWEASLFQRQGYPPLERRLRKALPFGVRSTRGGSLWFLLYCVWRATGQARRFMFPRFSDLESEITYLLVRETRPGVCVEISPAGGWSTSWILNALKDNRAGKLFSFDIRDDCVRLLPPELTDERWAFHKGDVRLKTNVIPESVDFLFLDSLHSGEFASWYVGSLFPRLKEGAPVVIDDIFVTDTLFTKRARGSPTATEPDVVLTWLNRRALPFFTVSEWAAPEQRRLIIERRAELGIMGSIIRSERDPALFFRYPYREPNHSTLSKG